VIDAIKSDKSVGKMISGKTDIATAVRLMQRMLKFRKHNNALGGQKAQQKK